MIVVFLDGEEAVDAGGSVSRNGRNAGFQQTENDFGVVSGAVGFEDGEFAQLSIRRRRVFEDVGGGTMCGYTM